MNDKVPVFGQRRAGVYLLSEIYNPDEVTSSVQNVGKAIPAVGSLVVDDSIGQHNTLYVVYSVDAVTFKSSLVPAATLASIGKDADIITYGNNVYMLYYKQGSLNMYELTTDITFRSDKTYYTRSGSSPNYTYEEATVTVDYPIAPNMYYERLNKVVYEALVDNKISIFGDTARYYSLFKGNNVTTGSDLPLISHYYVNDEGVVVESSRIPMDRLQVPSTNGSGELVTATARVPRVCYSAEAIEADAAYTFVVYDADGLVIAQIVMLGHEILGISSLAAVQWPITSFYVTANQIDTSDNKCYLVRGQNINELVLYPHIVYANGDVISEAGIDNTKLFIYGLEEISTAVPGSEYQVLLKYYLGNNESTSEDRDYRIGETARFIYTTVTVKIINSSSSGIAKISPILTRKSDNSGYDLVPLMYFKNKQAPLVPSNDDAIANFNGSTYNTAQRVKFKAYENVDATTTEFTNTFVMTLFNPASTPQVPFFYRQEPSRSGEYYGKELATAPRPRILRESGSGSTVIYKIPSDVFTTKDLFLNSFYYMSDPPVEEYAIMPVIPTHFLIRSVGSDGEVPVITTNPIPVDSYADAIGLIASAGISTATGVIVEFLYHDDSMGTAYDHLFGVPVPIENALA